MTTETIRIRNLRVFYSDLRRAQGNVSGRQLTDALRAAGKPPLQRAQELVPVITGTLQKGYRVRASGTKGKIASNVPYAAGAEWGTHGKWRGFTRFSGFGTGASAGRGRFVWRAIVERQEEIARIAFEGLREVAEIYGWARQG